MLRHLVLLTSIGFVASLPGLSEDYVRPSFCSAECPEFEILCAHDKYEVRRYITGTWASTKVRGLTLTEATSRGYWKLRSYIQGANDQGVRIPMTTPVLMTEISRRQSTWAMKDYTVSFFLPKELWDNVPKPTDRKVSIKETKEFIAFVSVFDGFATEPIPYQKSQDLAKILTENKEPYATGYYYTAVYNRPTVLEDRHNEVWLVLANNKIDSYTCVSGTTEKPVDEKPKVEPRIDQCKRVECPAHELVESYENGIEKRRYPDFFVVTKEIQSCWFEMAATEGFWALFRYISGENDREVKIPMTAPVAMTVKDNKEEKKKDKSEEGTNCARSFTMSFYIPQAYQDDPPQPTEDGMTIRRVQNITVYVKEYGGWVTPLIMDLKHRQAKRQLDSLGLCYTKKQFISLGYDSPTTLFNRRNEIWMIACENGLDDDQTVAPTTGLPTTEAIIADDTATVPDEATTSSKVVVPVDTIEEIDVGPAPPSSFPVCTDRNIICPEFDASEREGQVAKRKYRESKWIGKTLQACDVNEAQMVASRSLVNYFNGMNTMEAEIPMTAPVLITVHASQKGDRGCNNTYTVSFYIPEEFHDETPEPEDDDLYISLLMPHVFVQGFDSWTTVNKIEDTADEMKDELVDDNTCQSVEPTFYYVAGYDRPFSSHQPYSEVWIPAKFCFEDDLFNVDRQLNRLKKKRLFADPAFDGLEYKPPVCSDDPALCPPNNVDRIHLHYEERTYRLDRESCFSHENGVDYRGTVSTTLSGKTCQKWSEQTPHEHNRLPTDFPFAGLGDHNYCRNPDAEPKPWCYTTDPETRWDYCDVGEVGEQCGTKWACVDATACNFRSAFRKTNILLSSYATPEGNRDGIEFSRGHPDVYQMKISDLNVASCDKDYKVCSYLPLEFQDSPPQPVDPRVSIEEMPLTSFYVSAFGGHVSDYVISREVRTLQSYLEDDEVDSTSLDVLFMATYNSPRRIEDKYNEIWLPVLRE
ncbi:uncharacterized protein [Ptychodera flava]|uniref:uncharacterized protein n=1 Tax=Ptychodera flava TaxID=63121 RepID=UPI00396A4999